jgi:hypothetical protein
MKPLIFSNDLPWFLWKKTQGFQLPGLIPRIWSDSSSQTKINLVYTANRTHSCPFGRQTCLPLKNSSCLGYPGFPNNQAIICQGTNQSMQLLPKACRNVNAFPSCNETCHGKTQSVSYTGISPYWTWRYLGIFQCQINYTTSRQVSICPSELLHQSSTNVGVHIVNKNPSGNAMKCGSCDSGIIIRPP